MTKIARIGVDTSKSVFQLHGVDEADQVVVRRQLRRGKFLAFFARLEPTSVGLEACSGSHYWVRELRKLGSPIHSRARELQKTNDSRVTQQIDANV